MSEDIKITPSCGNVFQDIGCEDAERLKEEADRKIDDGSWLRDRDIELEDGWTLYFWRGLSFKWVLCDPEGRKVAMNDDLGFADTDEAIEWAERRRKKS